MNNSIKQKKYLITTFFVISFFIASPVFAATINMSGGALLPFDEGYYDNPISFGAVLGFNDGMGDQICTDNADKIYTSIDNTTYTDTTLTCGDISWESVTVNLQAGRYNADFGDSAWFAINCITNDCNSNNGRLLITSGKFNVNGEAIPDEEETAGFNTSTANSIISDLGVSMYNNLLPLIPFIFGLLIVSTAVLWAFKRLVNYLKSE